MVAVDTFRAIALSFPGATEMPHFEKTSFRVQKKIFATLDITRSQACIKLSGIDQDVFSSFNRSAIFPVPNKWGRQGWTFIRLDDVGEDILADALMTAYCWVAPKGLSRDLKGNQEEL